MLGEFARSAGICPFCGSRTQIPDAARVAQRMTRDALATSGHQILDSDDDARPGMTDQDLTALHSARRTAGTAGRSGRSHNGLSGRMRLAVLQEGRSRAANGSGCGTGFCRRVLIMPIHKLES